MAQMVAFWAEENLGLLSENNKAQAQREIDGKVSILLYPDAVPWVPCSFGFGWFTQPKGVLSALAMDNISNPHTRDRIWWQYLCIREIYSLSSSLVYCSCLCYKRGFEIEAQHT